MQRADDVDEAKKLIRGRAAVMAKIEKPQAIDRLAEIIEASDALMVARGDLGVELPLERVPSLQKQMTRMARRAGKPVVIATQMLELMIQSPVPTRAEVSDVATAVYEGADAIMLSAESAAGKFPVEAVSTMNRIGEEVERDPIYRGVLTRSGPSRSPPSATPSRTPRGRSPRRSNCPRSSAGPVRARPRIRVARERPKPPVVAITPNLATGRKLSVVWGVHCVVAEDAHDQDDMVDRAGSIAFRDGFAKAGQRVIIVAGVPLGTPGTTNMVRIASVGPDGDADTAKANRKREKKACESRRSRFAVRVNFSPDQRLRRHYGLHHETAGAGIHHADGAQRQQRYGLHGIAQLGGSSILSGASGPTRDSCSAPSSAVAANAVSCAGRWPARTAASIRLRSRRRSRGGWRAATR